MYSTERQPIWCGPRYSGGGGSAAFSYAGGGGGSLFNSTLYSLFADMSATNATFNSGDGAIVITLVAPKPACSPP